MSDKQYQEFLDSIPRIENSHKVHMIVQKHFKTSEPEEEKKDDGIILNHHPAPKCVCDCRCGAPSLSYL